MRRYLRLMIPILATMTSLAIAERPGDDAAVLASVNGEPVTLEEYLQVLGELHADAVETETPIPRQDPMRLLERLIDIRLILQEADAIGLDEQPEFRKPLAMFEEELMREALIHHASQGAPAPTAEEIEARYVDDVEEVELASVLFDDRERAESFLAMVGEGRDFAETARAWVDEGRARRFTARGYTGRGLLVPAVAEAIEDLGPGQTSAPIQLAGGVAVVRFFGTRLPDDPEAREQAERQLREAGRRRTARESMDALRAKYLVFDQPLIDSLDFEAEVDQFERYLEDDRVLVRIEGGDPIRVRDLASAIKRRMFHGVEQAAESKRLNTSKNNVLEELTTERVIQYEAHRLALDRTDDYRAAVQEFRNRTLFGLFISRVIDPSVEVTDDKIREYYEAHLADYRSPEMLKIRGLTFTSAKAAQQALEHLNAGADLEWMRVNAPDQLAAEEIPGELRFEGRLVTRDSLPQDLVEAITGAETGDYRTYADGAGRYHVLFVQERIPATPSPLESVRNPVAREVFLRERAAAVEDYMQKLRKASDIEIRVGTEELRALASAGGGPTADAAETP